MVTTCRKLGADHVILYKQENFAERVLALTEGRGADVILDHIGAAYLEPNLRSLAIYGRLVIIGLLGGGKAELNIGRMMVKRQRIIGSVLRARPIAEKARITAAFREAALAWSWPGDLRPARPATSTCMRRACPPPAARSRACTTPLTTQRTMSFLAPCKTRCLAPSKRS